ncbi:MAG: ABC transporter substrate-binding protein [Firmicutes bacterium]|nr:ABC transporter substrate-binding protein [Bacillota bacterium]
MKKKMRILSLVLSVVMTVSLFAGCSGNGGSAGGSDTIKVGLLAPATGEVAEYGIAVSNGAKLYISELNEKGGINGKKIELVSYDEEGDEAKALTGYSSLVDQGVTAIIGDVTTAPTAAVVVESQQDNMPMITASATAEKITCKLDDNGNVLSVYKNMFRSCFIDPFQGEKMASFAFEKLNAKTAAVLYNSGSDYSVGLYKAFVAKAKELGLEVVAEESYGTDAVDFQAQLTNIASKKPDVLFVPDYYKTIALIAQQAKNAGLTASMLGGDGWASIMDVIQDASLLNGAYFCSGYSTQDTSEAVQTFLTNYKAKYDSEPNMFAAQAYDAAAILCAALAKAEEQKLTAGSDEYKQAVIDAMKATDMDCVTGHITFDDYNNPQKTAVIINIDGGEAKFWGNY